MDIKLAEFQRGAVQTLLDSFDDERREVVLRSCTGSGKTLILTHFMAEYCRRDKSAVFIWLTPGAGGLEEQSKKKMDRYIPACCARLLPDVMAGGFHAGDCCFINWEKLIKKDSAAMREGERENFRDRVENAAARGLHFLVIVDESHHNDTVRADDILALFGARRIIRCSATPRPARDALLIDIPEEEVLQAGLIKRMLIINESFSPNISVKNQVAYLLDKALDKQRELRGALLRRGAIVNPLIIVQLPARADMLMGEAEQHLEERGVTRENGKLAIWLSEKKVNLEGIERNDAAPIAVIIKQAVATGWDCPRAYILVKLRENMGEAFEIQTIGRIRRMPQARHYGSDLLDSCYLYTLDEKFTQGARRGLGKRALEAAQLFLKPAYRAIRLPCGQKTAVPVTRDAAAALRSVALFYRSVCRSGADASENRRLLRIRGYVFADEIVKHTASGAVHSLTQEEFDKLRPVDMLEPLNTHAHGRDYHKRVSEIGLAVGLEYHQVNTILHRLFDRSVRYASKILPLDTRGVYAFVLNNHQRLREDFCAALTQDAQQLMLQAGGISSVEFRIPSRTLFTYDAVAEDQEEYTKNVYAGYLSSAEIRTRSEKLLEKYCQDSDGVLWFYKNGERGNEYFSLVYCDDAGRQRSFYPDYLIGTRDGLYIIETKGGFYRGGDELHDPFSQKKYDLIRAYLRRAGEGVKAGFVRCAFRGRGQYELRVCTDRFEEDIEGDAWRPLREVF